MADFRRLSGENHPGVRRRRLAIPSVPPAAGGIQSMHGFLRMQKGILEEDAARPYHPSVRRTNDAPSIPTPFPKFLPHFFQKVGVSPVSPYSSDRRKADSIDARLFAHAKRHPGEEAMRRRPPCGTCIHPKRPHIPHPHFQSFARGFGGSLFKGDPR